MAEISVVLENVDRSTFLRAGTELNFQQVTLSPVAGEKLYHASGFWERASSWGEVSPGSATAVVEYSPVARQVAIKVSNPVDRKWVETVVANISKYFTKKGATVARAGARFSRSMHCFGPFVQALTVAVTQYQDEQDAKDPQRVKQRAQELLHDPFPGMTLFFMHPTLRQKVLLELGPMA